MAISMLLFVSLTGASPMAAAAGRDSTIIAVDVDEGQVLHLPREAAQVFVVNPDIADIMAPKQRTMVLMGKKAGRTTVIALDAGGREIGSYTVVVTPGFTSLRDHLSRDYPQLPITVDSTPTSVIVAGAVDTPEQARGVMELVRAYVPNPEKVVNRMNLTSEVQVQLRVYVAEISRSAVTRFGANWQAVFKSNKSVGGLLTGRATRDAIPQGTNVESLFAGAITGNWSIASAFDLLADRGLATVLAEPTLTAISGQSASFLAGGEIPLVTTSGLNGTSVTYKEYGVRLNFTPTVLSHDRINLHVKPESSQITDLGSVEAAGITIPALSTRRVETTVELGSGDSFVIGGLLQNSRSNSRSGVPILSDIPVLGKLFQSETFQNDESELVVMITPYIVRPTKPGAPADEAARTGRGSDAGTLLTQWSGRASPPPPGARLNGRAGFAF